MCIVGSKERLPPQRAICTLCDRAKPATACSFPSKAQPVRVQAKIRRIPWYRLFDCLLFWQAVWFMYFQAKLSGAEAILLYSVHDVATTVLEGPSGYFSDRVGRRLTLVVSTL